MLNVNSSKSINNYFKERHDLLNTFKSIANHKDTANLISIKIFKKGGLLVEEHKPVYGIFLIIEGKVKIFNTDINQKTHILRFVSKGNFVGLSSLNSTYYCASAIAMENIKAYFIDLEHLQFILENDVKLSLVLINALAVKLRNYEIRQKHLTLFPATERIIDALLVIANKFGKTTNRGIEILIGSARKDIANFSNTSVEFAIRALSSLKSMQYIELEGRTIIIKEKEVLISNLREYACKTNKDNDVEIGGCYLDFLY
jgi:CRP/FNR family transcriptional regulator, anaerobic regulatory protein